MDDTIVIYKEDEVFFRVACNVSQSYELKEHFSCYVPNWRYSPKVKAKLWDGKISFFDRKDYKLPIGLYRHLKTFADKYGYKLEWSLEKGEMRTDITREDVQKFLDSLFKNSKYVPRDYQIESIFQALRKKRGIIMSPTASGKSLVIYAVIRFLLALDKKVLLVVPNINLTEQMYADFVDYGWTHCKDYVSVLHGTSTKYNVESPILVSTWQSIFKKQKPFFEEFGGILVDECHLSKAISLKSILTKSNKADFRIGLTGTLQTEPSDLLTIQGYLGPVIFQQTSSDLIDKGVLSKITIANLLLQYPEEVVDKNRYRPYAEEERTITEYEDRSKIFPYIIDHIDSKDNVLVLCRLIEHLKSIKKYLTEKYPDRIIYEVYGNTESEQRENIRKMANEQEGVIIVGTYATLSTGFNLPKLHHIIFASSFSSKIKILQSIGRGLRKHVSKKKLILWDIVDDLRFTKRTGNIHENYIFKHYKIRLRYYKEQGFNYITKKIKIDDL